tara:strand:- start:486 stop:605 length:120 start_codon:yes stop_codon:yes gene_type:complete
MTYLIVAMLVFALGAILPLLEDDEALQPENNNTAEDSND